MSLTVKCPHCGTDVLVTVFHDKNYGADADGRRGVEIKEIDEAYCTACEVDIRDDISEDVFDKAMRDYTEEREVERELDRRDHFDDARHW